MGYLPDENTFAQLVIQLRSVLAEYGLSGANIDGRHCDTVMPSTATARRASTMIEVHTYRTRTSALRIVRTPARQAYNQYSVRPALCAGLPTAAAAFLLGAKQLSEAKLPFRSVTVGH
jgi:hypothetical protein